MTDLKKGARVTYTIAGMIFRGVVDRCASDDTIVRLRCTSRQNNGALYLTTTNSRDWAIGWNTKAARALEAQTILESSA